MFFYYIINIYNVFQIKSYCHLKFSWYQTIPPQAYQIQNIEASYFQ